MINLLFAGNEKAFDGMITSALSITKYCDKPITAYLLTMDLTERKKEYAPLNRIHENILDGIYKRANLNSKAVVVDCTELYKKFLSGSVNLDNRYTPYAMLRLLAAKIDFADKILYLDTDVMARADITELYDVDIENFEFAAARDYLGRFFIGKNYFNSGVMLINLKKARKSGLFDKALNACRTQKMAFPDQTALNRSAISVKFLPMRFNEQKKETPDTVIRHFSKTVAFFPFPRLINVKPWQIEKMHKTLKNHLYDDELLKYAEIKTDYEKSAKRKTL